MDITPTIITAIVGLVFAIVSGIALHRLKRQGDRMDEFAEAIAVLKTTAVNDSHVRKIVKEELQPLASNSEKMLSSMHNIEIYIAEEKGYKAAQALLSRRKQDNHS